MNLLVPYECHHCGVVDEAKFLFAGPHIKQVCNNCGVYVKFYNKSMVPDVREVRLKIWALTQNVELINQCKKEIGFVDCLTGLSNKMIYWRLYLSIRSKVEGKLV